MGVKERLLILIEALNLDKATFERSVGLSNGFIDKASDNIRQSSLNRISNRYPNVNIEWLKYGEGEMTKTGAISVVGDNNISNTGKIEGKILYSSSEDVQLLKRRIKDLEEEVKQLKVDKAILQEFVTMLQSTKKK